MIFLLLWALLSPKAVAGDGLVDAFAQSQTLVRRLAAEQTPPRPVEPAQPWVERPGFIMIPTSRGYADPNRYWPRVVRNRLTVAERKSVLQLAFFFVTPHQDELESRVANGEVISEAELNSRYTVSEEDRRKVADWLASQGMNVVKMKSVDTNLFASGTVDQISRAFHVDFGRVTCGQAGKTLYFSALSAPSLPVSISALVLNVRGLSPVECGPGL